MNYRIVKRPWPMKRRWMWLTMLTELVFLIPLLVIFGIAQPNTWRTKMWEIGYANGWNSDPRMIVYAAANYRPAPTVPFVWSQMLTDFNVALTLVTLFALLFKMVLFIMTVYYPLFSVILNTCLTALWAVSVYGQMGPDHADERYPSNVAWYIARSCDAAGGRFNAVRECQLSKASFAVTVLMLALAVTNLGVGIWGMIPTDRDRKRRSKRKGEKRSVNDGSGSDSDSDDDPDDFASRAATAKNTNSDGSEGSSPVDGAQDGQEGPRTWEMATMAGARGGPASPRGTMAPYTPRTMAFHTLDRKLPLRQQ